VFEGVYVVCERGYCLYCIHIPIHIHIVFILYSYILLLKYKIFTHFYYKFVS
jgi:hypothetical protein